MRNSTRYSTVEQQTTELFTPTWQNRSTTRCQVTKLLLIFIGIVSVLSLTLCGFNNLVVDYTTTTPTNTTTTPTNTTTMPISTTTTTTMPTNTTTVPISTTTTTTMPTNTTPIRTTTVPISTTTTTTMPTNTTPISTTTMPISTTTTPISTTTTPEEETTLLSDLDYDDTTVQLLRTSETRPRDVVITNKTIVISEVNNSLTVFD